MRYITFFALGLLTMLVASSCGEDAFTQIVDIELPEHEPRLAIEALMFSENEEINILVSNSRSVLSKEAFFSFFPMPISSSPGPISMGLHLLICRMTEGITHSLVWIGAAADETYALDIQQADYPAISASQRMPEPPEIIEVTVEEDGALSDGFRPTG